MSKLALARIVVQIGLEFIGASSIAAELWEIAQNLHRLDLTKEQRVAHIRRYAELLKVKAEAGVSVHSETKPNPQGGRPKTSIVTKIAEDTGLSRATIHRALKPEPAAPVQPKPVRSDAEVILSQATKRGDDRLSPEPKLRC